jgi:hypothetical protein
LHQMQRLRILPTTRHTATVSACFLIATLMADTRHEHLTSSSAPSSQRNLVLGIVVIFWLIATAILLWWFQSRSIQSFLPAEQNPATLQPLMVEQMLQPLLAPAQQRTAVTLVHFWNPDCLCNQISRRHFDSLTQAFSAQQLAILVIAPTNTSDQQIDDFRRLNGSRMEIRRMPADQHWLPSSPSLALVRADGSLGYFGAYGFGALCSISTEDFFPNIVRQMEQGSYGPFMNMAGSGCFCRWPRTL